MAERMIQVPVSLIEGLLEDFGNRRVRAVRQARALLSQPTPTAEPMRIAQGEGSDRLIEYAEHILGAPLEPWQMRLCRRVFGGNVGRSTGRADPEPPRIEDMAPGTTFRAALVGQSRVEQWMRVNTCHPMARMRDGFHLWPGHIDPSTIRDVTPPA